MRFFIFIFSLYISVLAMMPCSDAMTCENEKKSHSATQAHHDHSEDKSDMCTPFCICSCCGGFVCAVNVPQFFTEKIKLDVPLFTTPYYSSFNSFYYHSFWQPPKLVF